MDAIEITTVKNDGQEFGLLAAILVILDGVILPDDIDIVVVIVVIVIDILAVVTTVIAGNADTFQHLHLLLVILRSLHVLAKVLHSPHLHLRERSLRNAIVQKLRCRKRKAQS